MGNLTAQGEINFNWSQDNRLLDVISLARSVGQYGYDGRGLRVKRTVDGATLYTLYDINGNLLAEVDSSGNVLREYAYLGSQKLTMFDYTIEQEFSVNIATSSGTLVEGVNIYAFNENNSYTGLSRTSDEQGRGLFDREDFGEGEYTFRVDYLGSQFWSAPVAVLASNSIDVVIEEEVASLTVTMDGVVQAGVKVYVFSTSGSYQVPDGTCSIRADYLGSQFWSKETVVTGATDVELPRGCRRL